MPRSTSPPHSPRLTACDAMRKLMRGGCKVQDEKIAAWREYFYLPSES